MGLWKQTAWGRHSDSACFLASYIHTKVWQEYKLRSSDRLRQQEKAQAEDLTNFFLQVKNWVNNPPSDGTFEHQVYERCKIALKNAFGSGWQDNSLFRVFESNPDSPHHFETEVSTIIETFIKTANEWNRKKGNNSIHINGQFDINTGRYTTINSEQTKNFVYQNLTQMFSDVSVRSMRTVGGKKTKEMVVSRLKTYSDGKTGSIFTISGKEIKTDIISPLQTEGTISFDFQATERTKKALQALNYATFSLKNYKDIFATGNLYNMVTSGDTNIIAVLLTIIPVYFPGGENEDFYTFMRAILSRYFFGQGKPGSSYRDNDPNVAPVNPVTANIDIIGLHFFHLQTVYELTGRGQQTGTAEIGELNKLLYQGTKFLLVNDNANGAIKCYSTRDLLYDLLNRSFSQNWRVDYHRHVNGWSGPSKITRYVRMH